MKKFKFGYLILLLIAGLLLQPSTAKEDEGDAPPDLSGRWSVHMRNSLGWKSCTFIIEQESGRLRGEVVVAGAPEIKLDGKFLEDNRIQLWATYRDGRTGASSDMEFKGIFEGEPGKEVMSGKAEYFEKRYDFTAKRSKKKKKKKK